MTKRKLVIIGSAAVIILLGVGGVMLFSRMSFTRSVTLSAQEQQQILAQILTRNTGAAVPSPQAATSGASLSVMAEDSRNTVAADLKIAPPGADGNNYRTSDVTYRAGPSMGKCKALGTSAVNYQYQTFEYNDGNGVSYYKNINQDESGQLTLYSLGKSSATTSEYYEYRGGKYAVKTVYTFDSSTPTPAVDEVSSTAVPGDRTSTSPVTQPGPDQIKYYFGEDAKIQSIVSEGGKEYYIVEYSFMTNCDQPMELLRYTTASPAANSQSPDKIVYNNWVDSTTYEIHKTFAYIGSVSQSNLIDTTVHTGEARKTDYASVSQNFNFDFSVEVRNLDPRVLDRTEEQEAQSTIDFLSTQNVDILLPANPDLKFTGLYADNPNQNVGTGWDYMQDRNFYPDGARGDTIFQEATIGMTLPDESVNPLVTVSANSSDYSKSMGINIYNAGHADDKLLTSQYGSYKSATSQELTWTIDGQAVKVKLYTVTVTTNYVTLESDTSGSTGASDGTTLIAPDAKPCAGDACDSVEKIVIFTYGDTKVVVTFSADLDIGGVKLTAYNTKNAAKMSELRTKLVEAYKQARDVSVNAPTEM